MKALIVEDDFTTRKILQKLLSKYGECDVAVNGKEALSVIDQAREVDSEYNLICLDIMMPEMDGQEALREIRKKEESLGIHGSDGVKIVMISGCDDKENILSSFRSGCEGYIVKPIIVENFLNKIKELGLIEQ